MSGLSNGVPFGLSQSSPAEDNWVWFIRNPNRFPVGGRGPVRLVQVAREAIGGAPMDGKDFEVAIAGAGPVGTVAAFYLACHGIRTLLLEAGDSCAMDLRASTFHPPTLEMLDTLGIAAPLIDNGLKAPVYHWRERQTGEVIAFDMAELADETRFPFRLQCEQYHLARMLAARLDEQANAQLLFGRRLIGLAQDADGVDVSVEGPMEIESYRVRYLIGADGANSIVRKLLGIVFEGFTYPEKFLCLTTDEPLDAHLPNLAPVNYVADAREWLVLLRVPSLWRVLVPAELGADDDWLRSDDKAAQVFDRLIARPNVATRHRTIYRVHQRVAKRFRVGRALIIGDAAHLNNPLGGFGMNSGIHDAFSLCARLVAILRGGEAADPLLDAFEAERRRITREFVQTQTIQNMDYLNGGDGAYEQRKAELLAIAGDPQRRRAYLRRQAMIESLSSVTPPRPDA